MTATGPIATAREEGRVVLTELESKELLKGAGIPVVESRLAQSRGEAVALAKSLGFPVVLKVVSPDILHKSDIGGVKVGLRTERQVGVAYDAIMAAVAASNPEARLHGVNVQAMAPPGLEVIMGMTTDSQLGPVLMFGLGGVMVEVLKDVAFRIVPLTRRDAHQMVQEIKGYPMLQGFRGQEKVDISKLEEALLNLSAFVEQHAEVKELDLNPILAYKDSIVAVDARIILADA